MHKRIRLITALVLGMAVLLIPTIAIAAITINVADQGLLVDKGQSVLVSVEVTCEPGLEAGADVQITQRHGSHVAKGFGSSSGNKNCDGTPLTFEIRVPIDPFSDEEAFHTGPAVARASTFAHNPDFSKVEQAQASGEIQLVKK